jgi:hypothetical protein
MAIPIEDVVSCRSHLLQLEHLRTRLSTTGCDSRLASFVLLMSGGLGNLSSRAGFALYTMKRPVSGL